MKKTLLAVVLLLGPAVAAQAQSVVGDWRGALVAGGNELPVVVHLTTRDDGSLGATLDSPTQGAIGIPVETATFVDRTLTLVVTAVRGRFVGTLNDNGGEIAGTWSQNGASLPLTLTRATDAAAAPPRRPQNPQKPYPYQEEEVAFTNPASGFQLAGTLTLPQGAGPFPAAILLTGSGPQNRDEALAGHRPFLVLADRLTRAGIAVLRVDDRGVGKSAGNFASATMRDFATDAEAGIEFLRGRTEIRKDRIGLVGHSEGGLVAPMVATRRSDVAFVVLLAGPAVEGDLVLIEQARLIAAASGAPAATLAALVAQQRELSALLKSASSSADALQKLTVWSQDKVPVSQLPAAQVAMMTGDWFRQLLAYDPAPALRQLTCPVLALDGSKDLQVPAAQNVPALKAALAGNPQATVEELPGLNHLFQTAGTGAPGEYGTIEETMAPIALEKIATWIVVATK